MKNLKKDKEKYPYKIVSKQIVPKFVRYIEVCGRKNNLAIKDNKQ